MNRRRVIPIAAVLALLIGVGVGTIYAGKRWRAHAPARAYERIALGMSLEEVSRIIGLPPGDYSDRAGLRFGTMSGPIHETVHEAGPPRGAFPPETKIPSWAFDEFSIWIWLDADGKAGRTKLGRVVAVGGCTARRCSTACAPGWAFESGRGKLAKVGPLLGEA